MKLLSLSLPEMTELIRSYGAPAYRAKQLYSALLSGKSVEDVLQLPGELRARLLEDGHTAGGVKIHQRLVSTIDGTVKYLYELEDGNIIEGVLMHYSYGNTLCVSTQVGCRMGCAFCASTLGGLVRSLEPGEILGQVVAANADAAREKGRRGVTNLVLMGSGEPLDNYDAVLKFLRLVSNPDGLQISQRNISVSTCGLVPRIRQLAQENLGITLSLSLHAPEDAIRRQIMPVSKAYTIEETVDAMREYVRLTGRRVVFEYALIGQKNDSERCAVQLARLLRGMQCHVNLIPLNSVKESPLKGVTPATVRKFQKTLEENHISVTVRREMGADISGACGQLRRSYLEKEAAENAVFRDEHNRKDTGE